MRHRAACHAAASRLLIIFGETGSGKSSIINAITKNQLAKTTNDADACTSGVQRYPVDISSQSFVLFDTAGLGEGPVGTVPDPEAKRQLKNLLRQLMSSRSPSDGIDLLVYCALTRMPGLTTIVRAYDTFYSRTCRKNVTIGIVITGLENEPNMENWWDENKGRFESMHFAGHACVTALQEYPDIPDDVTRRISESSDTAQSSCHQLLVSSCQ